MLPLLLCILALPGDPPTQKDPNAMGPPPPKVRIPSATVWVIGRFEEDVAPGKQDPPPWATKIGGLKLRSRWKMPGLGIDPLVDLQPQRFGGNPLPKMYPLGWGGSETPSK